MNQKAKNYNSDYRVNVLNNNTIISVEVTCCGRHIGEMRYKDGESKKCSLCGTVHSMMVQHNHFHIRPIKPESDESLAKDDNKAALNVKVL
ncbi:MAG: hypothetical protein A4E55_02243 [Pelotomaculum sp. PtaU1.Bin035]|nr:MAG: hypothetical protein A4E55_02243 [Pelotomaculum sp. PtaU1.Bin035]